MRHVWFGAMALLLSAFASAAFAQGANETIDVGGWKISDSHKGSVFQGCTAINTFDDGSMVGLAATKDVTLMLVAEPKSGLTTDQRYQVKYSFDNGAKATVQGYAKDADKMFIPIPDADVKPFMAASKLNVSYGGTDYEEPLDGSKDAVGAMAKCMDAGAAEK